MVPGKTVSRRAVAVALAGAALFSCLAWAQYPGQLTKKSKGAPDLRAIAVLEWTGEAGKPKACRIVPVTVFDGEKLQDAGVYLARPEPLALSGEVEYELKQNGKTFGLFDVKNSGQEQGTWVGYGDWKPAPVPKQEAAAPQKIDEDIEDDKPVLHRKKHTDEAPGAKPGSAGSGSPSSSTTPAEDPDRPKLHKKTSDDSSGSSTSSAQAPAPDPDRPRVQKKPNDSSESSSSSGSDPDRPQLKKGKPKPPEDVGHVDSVRELTDPDRPLLKRGKVGGSGLDVAPSLMGLPPDMQQAVAVSDAKTRPEHPWSYSWANPGDEAKMKAALEDIAREALGISAPPAPVPAAPPKRANTAAARRAAKPAAAPLAPVALGDEQFRVFELAYGAGATLVLTARTDGPPATQKFVTIVAQPDLYGKALVLLKSVTDVAHLEETPRMRLVDAVDALADNRGELLFELRGEGSRQFALYRIYRGVAEKLFVSGGGVYGSLSSD